MAGGRVASADVAGGATFAVAIFVAIFVAVGLLVAFGVFVAAGLVAVFVAIGFVAEAGFAGGALVFVATFAAIVVTGAAFVDFTAVFFAIGWLTSLLLTDFEGFEVVLGFVFAELAFALTLSVVALRVDSDVVLGADCFARRADVVGAFATFASAVTSAALDALTTGTVFRRVDCAATVVVEWSPFARAGLTLFMAVVAFIGIAVVVGFFAVSVVAAGFAASGFVAECFVAGADAGVAGLLVEGALFSVVATLPALACQAAGMEATGVLTFPAFADVSPVALFAGEAVVAFWLFAALAAWVTAGIAAGVVRFADVRFFVVTSGAATSTARGSVACFTSLTRDFGALG